jgi:hypothetical protein
MSALPLTRRSATLECLLRARDLGLDRSEPLLVLGALLLGFFACLVNRLGDEGVAAVYVCELGDHGVLEELAGQRVMTAPVGTRP